MGIHLYLYWRTTQAVIILPVYTKKVGDMFKELTLMIGGNFWQVKMTNKGIICLDLHNVCRLFVFRSLNRGEIFIVPHQISLRRGLGSHCLIQQTVQFSRLVHKQGMPRAFCARFHRYTIGAPHIFLKIYRVYPYTI